MRRSVRQPRRIKTVATGLQRVCPVDQESYDRPSTLTQALYGHLTPKRSHGLGRLVPPVNPAFLPWQIWSPPGIKPLSSQTRNLLRRECHLHTTQAGYPPPSMHALHCPSTLRISSHNIKYTYSAHNGKEDLRRLQKACQLY